ncbi:hypothetical protein GCM10025864_39170 [Luteimicrobium album]|uniref:Uncharacterized protein n=1 Tax=Luteimicrobium album TaxID=1054550 RepID=A0ABQ6I5U5_9MICO|nr:hypothetical protein GCM10025864_39170 [Luteimicrobium album]
MADIRNLFSHRPAPSSAPRQDVPLAPVYRAATGDPFEVELGGECLPCAGGECWQCEGDGCTCCGTEAS